MSQLNPIVYFTSPVFGWFELINALRYLKTLILLFRFLPRREIIDSISSFVRISIFELLIETPNSLKIWSSNSTVCNRLSWDCKNTTRSSAYLHNRRIQQPEYFTFRSRFSYLSSRKRDRQWTMDTVFIFAKFNLIYSVAFFDKGMHNKIYVKIK